MMKTRDIDVKISQKIVVLKLKEEVSVIFIKKCCTYIVYRDEMLECRIGKLR